jgi:hypothetical protein
MANVPQREAVLILTTLHLLILTTIIKKHTDAKVREAMTAPE